MELMTGVRNGSSHGICKAVIRKQSNNGQTQWLIISEGMMDTIIQFFNEKFQKKQFYGKHKSV